MADAQTFLPDLLTQEFPPQLDLEETPLNDLEQAYTRITYHQEYNRARDAAIDQVFRHLENGFLLNQLDIGVSVDVNPEDGEVTVRVRVHVDEEARPIVSIIEEGPAPPDSGFADLTS